MAPSVGFLIYSGTMPLLKIYVATFFGYILAKRGLFPPAASRGASQVSMNLSLPCLIFANVVPAFTPSNISAIGPLMLLSYIYQAFGFALGLAIREFTFVPRNFWQGIIILCGMSNWGNLPNAVVLTVTGQAPFDSVKDPVLGVSFVAIFIVSYHITFWVFGAAASLSWDYRPHVPQGERALKRVRWDQKPIGGWVARVLLKRNVEDAWTEEKTDTKMTERDAEKGVSTALSTDTPVLPTLAAGVTPAIDTEITEVELSRQVSHSSRLATNPKVRDTEKSNDASAPSTASPPTPEQLTSAHFALVRMVLKPLRAAANSITITLVVALVIAVIPSLKALFVPLPPTSGSGPTTTRWAGPDGRPPLAFLIDTAAFVGGICVPLALILLGASFARLRIPRPLSRLPFPAMLAAALGKMVVLPVIGVLVVEGMTKKGMMSRDARAERFVGMFLSGTPAAVNQLIVASLYSTDGDVDTLSAFLLVQYVLMFFTSAALTAVALALL